MRLATFALRAKPNERRLGALLGEHLLLDLARCEEIAQFAPGDMFSTGAPGGVAVGQPNAADLFLKPGDVIECAFEKPAMVLRNRVVAPA